MCKAKLIMAPSPLKLTIRGVASIAMNFAVPFITIQGQGNSSRNVICVLEVAYGLNTD